MDPKILMAAMGGDPGDNTGVNVFQEILKIGWLPPEMTVDQFAALPNKDLLIERYYKEKRGMVKNESGVYAPIVGGTTANTNPGGYSNPDAEMFKATMAALSKGQAREQ